MATIGGTFQNLIDLYKGTDENRAVAEVIEALHTLNPLMQDAYTVECNKGTSHLTSIRTGLPSVAWGALYSGIPQSKSTVMQVEDTTGFVEGLSSVDKRLLDLSPNPAATRMMEATSFLEAISQEVQSSFFYSNSDLTPKKFHGLAARYAKLPTANEPASNQVVNAGGSGSDNTSIWMCTWGPMQTHLITPKGIPGGIQREDKGEQRVTDASNNPYFVKEELFTQHVGVAVRDWRYNVRVANIDVSDMQAGSVDLYKFLRKAYYKFEGRRNAGKKNGGMVTVGKPVIYCNRDVLEALDALATNRGSTDNFVRLQRMEVQGEEVIAYRGIPIRETDAILNTEAALT